MNWDDGSYTVHTEPNVQPISCHISTIPWQEPEEANVNNILQTVSDKDLNVKVKMSLDYEVLLLLHYNHFCPGLPG